MVDSPDPIVATPDGSIGPSEGGVASASSAPLPASPTASTSSTASTSPSPETTSSNVTEVTAPEVSVTTAELTTTTFDTKYVDSPRAFVLSPADEAIVSGDLAIEGRAQYRAGVTGVRLVIRNVETDMVWQDSTKSFTPVWERFLLPVVTTGPTEATWSYSIDAAALTPGRYLIRVWAVGPDANDPVSNQRHVTIVG